MQLIPRATILDILAQHGPAARAAAIAIPFSPREHAAAIAAAVADTGYLHGLSDAQGEPWDYTPDEVAHSLAEWVSMRDAKAYLLAYQNGRAAAAATIRHGDPLPYTPDMDCPDCGGDGIIPATSHAHGYAYLPCDTCRDTVAVSGFANRRGMIDDAALARHLRS